MRRLAAALLLASPLAAAWAQAPAGTVEIDGRVEQPARLTMPALAALPTVAVHAVREGGAATTYVGPLLWPLLAAARLVDEPGKGAHLQHVLLARGADGYAAAVAIGEIEPGFENKPVIIALEQDGAPLARPRLVVPGDAKAGRAVRDLVAIEVR